MQSMLEKDEIVFTSGATESDNLAIRGVMERYKDKGDHIITCVTEHEAVLEPIKHLENIGKKVTYLPVDDLGRINIGDLESAITDKTVMISAMAANNEIGVISDIRKIGRVAHENNVLFHTDAAQAVGNIPIDVNDMNIDLMSFSAHKMYGPKGVGALYIRGLNPRVSLSGITFGGGQERGLRSGTLNVPGIVGFRKAITIAVDMMGEENRRLKRIANEMLGILQEEKGVTQRRLGAASCRKPKHLLSWSRGEGDNQFGIQINCNICRFCMHHPECGTIACDNGTRIWRRIGHTRQ